MSDPGVDFKELRWRLRLSYLEAMNHIHTLRMEGIIVARRDGAQTRFIPAGILVADPVIRLTRLQKLICEIVQEVKSTTSEELGRQLDMPVRIINREISLLVETGAAGLDRFGITITRHGMDESRIRSHTKDRIRS